MKCLKPYDVFISHALEDQSEITDPLYRSLKDAGIKIWYSSRELNVGDSIRTSIKKGMKRCRFCIVILSENYIRSVWANYELRTFMEEYSPHNRSVLPLWHNMQYEEVSTHYSELIDIFGIPTNQDKSILIDRIRKSIKDRSPLCSLISNISHYLYLRRKVLSSVIIALFLLTTLTTLYFYAASFYLPAKVIQKTIESQSCELDNILPIEYNLESSPCPDSVFLRSVFSTPAQHSADIMLFTSDYKDFNNNESWLEKNGINRLYDHIKRGRSAGGYEIYALPQNDNCSKTCFLLKEKRMLSFEIIDKVPVSRDEIHVTVSYKNFVRFILIDHNSMENQAINRVVFVGCQPQETFVFKRKDFTWQAYP